MSVLIDTQRYDVEMLPVNVLMLEDDIRLVAVTHTFHVFLCDLPELFVGQLVFRRRNSAKHGKPYWSFCCWLRGTAGNSPCRRRHPVACVCRTAPASFAKGHLGFILIHFSPCYSARLRRARNPTLYSQPFLSLFGKVQYLDTKGFQFPHALFQCGDLMRDCDVGKVRIDGFHNLIM